MTLGPVPQGLEIISQLNTSLGPLFAKPLTFNQEPPPPKRQNEFPYGIFPMKFPPAHLGRLFLKFGQ